MWIVRTIIPVEIGEGDGRGRTSVPQTLTMRTRNSLARMESRRRGFITVDVAPADDCPGETGYQRKKREADRDWGRVILETDGKWDGQDSRAGQDRQVKQKDGFVIVEVSLTKESKGGGRTANDR